MKKALAILLTIRSMPFLQSSPHWRKNFRSRKKQNRNQPKHEVPVNHRPMACRNFFCTEFTCILCGVGNIGVQGVQTR